MIKNQTVTENYALYNGDCVEIMSNIPDESIHLSVYSPPFSGLYLYSSDERDLSNCRNYTEFMEHYEYVISELYRITIPGRMTAVHCMDIPQSNSGRGDLLRDFPGDIIRLHTKCRNPKCTYPELERQIGMCGHGWFGYNARYHVWKEPLTVRNRTMMKALAHQTIVEDSTKCSVASADYLLVFRRSGENPIPVPHPNGLTRYAGARQMPSDVQRYEHWQGAQIENRFSHWIWRQYASAFWDDVRLDRVLPYKQARDEEDEKHVHPLQLDVIERTVILFSNPGETVFTPFMGVGSEVYGAVLNERRGIGVELKPSYYNQAVKNVAEAVNQRYSDTPLFHYAQEVTHDDDSED